MRNEGDRGVRSGGFIPRGNLFHHWNRLLVATIGIDENRKATQSVKHSAQICIKTSDFSLTPTKQSYDFF